MTDDNIFDAYFPITTHNPYSRTEEIPGEPFLVAALGISYAKFQCGTLLVVPGYQEEFRNSAVNLRNVAHANNMNFAFLQHIYFDGDREMSALDALKVAVRCTFKKLYNDKQNNQFHSKYNLSTHDKPIVLYAHSMACRAITDLATTSFAPRMRDLFAEYIFAEPYLLTSPTLIQKMQRDEKLGKHTKDAKDLTLPDLIKFDDDKKFDSRRIHYSDEYLYNIIQKYRPNMVRVLAGNPIHFFAGGKSREVNPRQTQTISELLDYPNYSFTEIPNADHNFATSRHKKHDYSPDPVTIAFYSRIGDILSMTSANYMYNRVKIAVDGYNRSHQH